MNESIDFKKNPLYIDVSLFNQTNLEETTLEQWCISDNIDEISQVPPTEHSTVISLLCRQLYTFLRLSPSYNIYAEKKRNSNLKLNLTYNVKHDNSRFLNTNGPEFKTSHPQIKVSIKVIYVEHYNIPSTPINTSSKVIDEYDPKSLPKDDEFSKSPPIYGSSGSYGKSPSELFSKRIRTSSQTGSIAPFVNSPTTKTVLSNTSEETEKPSSMKMIITKSPRHNYSPSPMNSLPSESTLSTLFSSVDINESCGDDVASILRSLGELTLPTRNIYELLYKEEDRDLSNESM